MNRVFAWAIPNFNHNETDSSNHLELAFVNTEALVNILPPDNSPSYFPFKLESDLKSAQFIHVTGIQLLENKCGMCFVKAVVSSSW